MRMELIETSDSQMRICNQCELLNVSGSTLYCTSSRVSDKDLEIMKKLDMLYQEEPTQPGDPAEWPGSSGSLGTKLVTIMPGGFMTYWQS